jgi:hypothetical protein
MCTLSFDRAVDLQFVPVYSTFIVEKRSNICKDMLPTLVSSSLSLVQKPIPIFTELPDRAQLLKSWNAAVAFLEVLGMSAHSSGFTEEKQESIRSGSSILRMQFEPCNF